MPSRVPYTSSVPGSLPSLLAFRGREHRVTLPKRYNPFLGRDRLVKAICHEWENSKPRRISLSGVGGAGKTELSISIIEDLGPMRYVLWLRASDDRLPQKDLATAAQDLRNELLRFESGNQRAIGDDRAAAAFYFSGVPVSDLVGILKRWLKTTPEDGSRIMVVLDDLDGLESSHHEDYSVMFSGDALDLIYTTRDPSLAERGMLWPAVNFDVPSLQADHAVDVLEYLSKDSRPARAQSGKSSVQNAFSLELETARKAQMRDIANRLGAVPAAITLGSHYMRDNLGSNWNPDSYKKFIESWDQDNGKSYILRARRDKLRYRHSMLASFEVSLDRLRRNVKDNVWHYRLGESCVALLQLLSAMNVDEISQNDLSEFKSALGTAWQDLHSNIRKAEFSDVENYIDTCIAELKKVSLLTERLEDGPEDGPFLLNNVTKACALLVPTNISHDELVTLQLDAKEVSRHWIRFQARRRIAGSDCRD